MATRRHPHAAQLQIPPKNPRFKLDNSAAIDRPDGGRTERFAVVLDVTSVHDLGKVSDLSTEN